MKKKKVDKMKHKASLCFSHLFFKKIMKKNCKMGYALPRHLEKKKEW